MKIQLLSLVSAAVALSLPEIPALPDLVEIVENSFHGNFTAQTVEEPKAFLPTIAEIRAMTDQERAERFHWFLCVFLLVFLCVVISGTVIMVVGAWLKACGSYQALDRTAALSRMAQLGLVMLSLGGTVSLSLAATLWSMASGTLSKTFGLDWEIYLVLFCCAGASLLVQAVLAVTWLKAGDSFDWTAFAVASFSSMAPVISDQCDTLKDIIFGGFCLQSQNFFMKMVGVLSWSYLLAFHAWFIFLEAVNESDALGANCFNELATSHLSVLLIAPKVQGEWSEWSGGCCQGIKMTILPTIYRQVTKSKLHHLLIENVPQALMSFLFLAIEGGSVFVAVLNLVIPGVQIALTFLLFKPVRSAAIPALGKKLSRAMKSGNIVAAKALWEEVAIWYDMQLFALMLPHLTFFLDVTERCGFMSEELKDLTKLGDEELDTLQPIALLFEPKDPNNLSAEIRQRVAAVVAGEDLNNLSAETLKRVAAVIAGKDRLEQTKCCCFTSKGSEDLEKRIDQCCALQTLKRMIALWFGREDKCDLHGRKMGDSGAKVVAEALKSSTTVWLGLYDNEIREQGAEALAESFKSNGNLEKLYLQNNKIGGRGAEALAESLKNNGSLEWLCLDGNTIGDRGAEALAESLKSNGTLSELGLQNNHIGDRGAEALAAGLLQNRSLRKLHLSEFGSSLLGLHRTSGRQALDEAEKMKKERGDDFRIVWWLN